VINAEDEILAFNECRDKIMALLEESSESTGSQNDSMIDVVDVSLNDLNSSSKISISGYFSPRTREEIIAIASEFNFPVFFEMDKTKVEDDVLEGNAEPQNLRV
jgi:hypothetical protein